MDITLKLSIIDIIKNFEHIGYDCAMIIWDYINFSDEALKIQNLKNGESIEMNLNDYLDRNEYREKQDWKAINMDWAYITRNNFTYDMIFIINRSFPWHKSSIYTCEGNKFSTIFEFTSMKCMYIPGEPLIFYESKITIM